MVPQLLRRAVGILAVSASVIACTSLPVAFTPLPIAADPLFLSSADQGPWLGTDKELHFAASLAIAASLRIEGRNEGTAVAATVGVGLLKEAYDVALKPRRLKRGASWKDLAADLAGALAGIAIVGALDHR
jgi:uncharacterized protein YfiM (DUF2279 family)